MLELVRLTGRAEVVQSRIRPYARIERFDCRRHFVVCCATGLRVVAGLVWDRYRAEDVVVGARG